MRGLIIDTETTDVEEPEVIEVAWEWMGNDFSYIGAPYHQRFEPTLASTFGALAAHHILPKELAGCPPSYTAGIPHDVDFLIGHNIDFDWKALGSPDVRRICTLALARDAWPDLDSHKLGALMYYVNGINEETRNLLRDAHSAKSDVVFCRLVLHELVRHYNASNLLELYKISEEARLPKTMTFGKYKGRPITEVDQGWITWYRKQPDTDPYLLMAFSRYCKR